MLPSLAAVSESCCFRCTFGATLAVLANTDRRRLREVALDQHGLVTTDDARALGIPPGELRGLARRRGLTRVGHGVYRFDDAPAGEHDGYMEAVLRVGPDAMLAADAVLSMLDLALANPKRLCVVTPHRVRKQLPDYIEIVHRPDAELERAEYDGVPAQPLATEIRESRGMIMGERLLDAVHEARRRGLLLADEARQLEAEIGGEPDA